MAWALRVASLRKLRVVELRPLQQRVLELTLPSIQCPQVGAAQIGAAKIGAIHRSFAEIRPQLSAPEERPLKATTLHIGIGEGGTAKARLAQTAAPQDAVGEIQINTIEITQAQPREVPFSGRLGLAQRRERGGQAPLVWHQKLAARASNC
jgi:hypothetical protein